MIFSALLLYVPKRSVRETPYHQANPLDLSARCCDLFIWVDGWVSSFVMKDVRTKDFEGKNEMGEKRWVDKRGRGDEISKLQEQIAN